VSGGLGSLPFREITWEIEKVGTPLEDGNLFHFGEGDLV